MFNINKFALYLTQQQEAYIALLFSSIEKSSPGWTEKIKTDLDLLDEKGNSKPLTELTDEQLQAKILAVLSDPNFIPPTIDKETVYKLFTVDKELLDKFML